ncbi:MAG TPA: phage holin family protein, partial [Pseudolabrys sp.]|nr:phage holin family protein [Pseudolabrys sp.]
MQPVFRHVRLLWRAERAIAETRLNALLRRAVLFAFAGLIALFALAMLNVAGYFFFVPHWGPLWAALATALGDLVVAIIVVLIALATKPGPELAAAHELRDLSVESLEAEFAPLKERFSWLTQAAREPLQFP